MDDGVDDRPPPPPTFKLNETGDEYADLPAWKRAALEAAKQQGGGAPAETAPVHKMIKVPVIKGFKSTLGKGLGVPKMPAAAMAKDISETPPVPETPVPVPDVPVPETPPAIPAAAGAETAPDIVPPPVVPPEQRS